MRHSRLTLASILWLIILLPSFALTATAKDTWISVRTTNFYLVGNAGEKEIRAVGTRLEQFRDVFSRLFPGLKLASPVPTTVVVFKNNASYRPFKPLVDGKINDVGGYFQAGQDVNYITLTTQKQSENPYRVIFHEYVHLLVRNSMGHANVPPWFNEGLAEYYSTFEIEGDRKVFLGQPLYEHLQLLRNSKLLPLKTLLSVDYHSLQRNKHEARGLFYAQSWALVHYLIHGNEGEQVSKLQEFVNLLLGNTDLEEAFRKIFNTDYEGMEKQLKDYIQKRSYRINVATFREKLEFDSKFQTTRLSDGEAQAYLGDLLYHIQRLDDAAATLEKALELDPTVSMAHASLGMVRLNQKNLSAAKEHLQKALEAKSNNYLAHYYYSYMLSREHMTEGELVSDYPTETAATMRTNLLKAIELKPDFPESYKLLAFINLVRGDNLDESADLLKKALALSPGNEAYLFVLAQVYLRQEDLTAAAQIIEPLATGSLDQTIRGMAQSLKQSMVYIQERIDLKKQAKAAGTDAPQLSARTMNSTSHGRTSDEVVVDQIKETVSYLEEALRKPADGEVRLQGLLTRIDCGAQEIFFTIKRGQQSLRLRVSSFSELDITTYASDVRGEITCGVRKPENSVVITYIPARDQRSKVDGTAVSIEFVPSDFSLGKAN